MHAGLEHHSTSQDGNAQNAAEFLQAVQQAIDPSVIAGASEMLIVPQIFLTHGRFVLQSMAALPGNWGTYNNKPKTCIAVS